MALKEKRSLHARGWTQVKARINIVNCPPTLSSLLWELSARTIILIPWILMYWGISELYLLYYQCYRRRALVISYLITIIFTMLFWTLYLWFYHACNVASVLLFCIWIWIWKPSLKLFERGRFTWSAYEFLINMAIPWNVH